MTADAWVPRFGAAITTLVLAVFDLCPGCHMYLLIQRIRPAA